MRLTLFLLAFGFSLHAATVTFDDYANAASNPQAASFSSGGLTFTNSRGCLNCLYIVGNPTGPPFSGLGVTAVSNGTVMLGASSEENGGVIVTSPGTLFALCSVDLDRQ